jgi:aminoglycoside 2''-phosphotransferase
MIAFMDSPYQSQLEAIKHALPDQIQELSVIEGGEDFLIFEVNAEWMFRFARNEITRAALQREVIFLAQFSGRSPLPVPNYQFTGEAYGAYRKIQGVPLSFEFFQALTRSARAAIGRQLAAFLSVIHRFPVAEANNMCLTVGWNGLHHQSGQDFLALVAPRLAPTTRRNAVDCMETLLAEDFDAAVIHGDFYLPDHVFYDEETGQLGVIDFADATIYDAAHDWQAILEICGQRFFELVMGDYQGPQDSGLLKRSQLRLAARPLFTAGRIFAAGIEDQYDGRLAAIEAQFG